MKIKHNDLLPEPSKPFDNCKLNRGPYAQILTEIVGTYSDGFVMAVNNDWGAGKTTFIKMWEQFLKDREFQTIYFNAWENDFETSPLIAIMAEFKKISHKDKDWIDTLSKRSVLIAKHMAPVLMKALADKYINVDKISEGIEKFTKGAAEILESEINEYAQRKENIIEFKQQLTEFVSGITKNKPLVFFIDELDRCRPTYAVELLEQIKHLFSVPGIVFVLSIDKGHLASSIKGFYGSENINTDEYLRRFIDLEYSIPEPSREDFINYLYEYYNFKEFYSDSRNAISDFSREPNNLIKMATLLFNKSNATLRQMEKVYSYTRLVLRSFNSNFYTLPRTLFLLIYLKIFKFDVYLNIGKGAYTIQELSDIISDILYSDRNSNYSNQYVLAKLLFFYENNNDYYDRKEIEGYTLISTLENAEDEIKNLIKDINKTMDINRINIGHFINKINLTEQLNS